MNLSSPPISVVILTQDEEINIGDCLDSVATFDDVHILDSGSSDGTLAIVRDKGRPIYSNPFTGFGDQRNWAIDNIAAKHQWHLHLDADERMTPELVSEMCKQIEAQPSVGGYFVPSKLMFCDKWLKHAGDYPTYQVRLFRPDRLRFANHGHGQREITDFPLGKLREPYLHYAFRKGLELWFSKHSTYAKRDSEQVNATTGSFFSSDPVERRRHLKGIASNLPFRYFLRLFYLCVFKKAFLDGKEGLIFANMMAIYEAMIEVYSDVRKNNLRP